MNRKPRILWANFYCLLDTSSGASMSIRQALLQLAKRGWEVQTLGATIFDSPNGQSRLRQYSSTLDENRGSFVRIIDERGVPHFVLVTQSTLMSEISQKEQLNWYSAYQEKLDTYKPDLVWFYGGQWTSSLIPLEARLRDIPSAYYLVNQNHSGIKWCRDVDLIITDTKATRNLYRAKEGVELTPVGKFINKDEVIAEKPSEGPKFVTFINPHLPKGSAIVAAVAYIMENRRPDIQFQVVESRGDWKTVLETVTALVGDKRTELKTVTVRENTSDMASVYASTHVLLAPSLWYESGARVLAEAMYNGIPTIVSDHGGNAEMIGEGGIKIRLPDKCHEKPYTDIPSLELLEPFVRQIESLFDDEERYRRISQAAKRVGTEKHDIEVSTDRLIAALQPLIDHRAGDGNFYQKLNHWHKQRGGRLHGFQPGTVPWLAEKEKQYGGLQTDVVRRRQSNKDPRSPDEFSAGWVKEDGRRLPKHIGGDRMALGENRCYGPAYSRFLKPFYQAGTTAGLTIVEVGILRGHGLAIWCDLFPDARVIGLDLDPDIFGEHRPVLEQRGAFKQNTPEVYAFDQFDPDTDLLSHIATNGKIDVFIDDGAHTCEAILGTLDAVKDHLSESAVYIIEDFVGIDTEVRERLPGWRVLSHDLMTVATNLTSGVPDYVPSKRDYLSGALDAE